VDDCSVAIEQRRRFQREVARDGEGDDLIDQGSESAEYTFTGRMDDETYLKVLKVFRAGTCWLIEPFEENELKVCFAKLCYDSSLGTFKFLLIQDAI
jgi:hypothetical protein